MVASLTQLGWILLGGLLMAMVTLVGALIAVLPMRRQERLLVPLIALAAGSLLGGALFHMLPEGVAACAPRWAGVWLASGFTTFLAMELALQWHQSHHRHARAGQPVALLILLGDGLHNFIGGVGIASTFLLSPSAGVAAWLAALAHEIPQELGDFGVLVHGGWSRGRALRGNFISGLTFPLGGMLAWLWAGSLPLGGLMLFAAGNFLYIAASDLVPEIKVQSRQAAAFVWFVLGLLLLLWPLLLKHG